MAGRPMEIAPAEKLRALRLNRANMPQRPSQAQASEQPPTKARNLGIEDLEEMGREPWAEAKSKETYTTEEEVSEEE